MKPTNESNGQSRAVRIALIAPLLALIAAAVGSAQSADEIIRRMEANQVHETARSEGRMEIHDRFGERTSTFISWSSGEDDVLIEFTSASERGQKVLRTDNQIYLYYPDASRLIRMQGSALRESMLGSDVSYEDMTGNRGVLDSYRAELTGRETINGNECFVVELTATSRDVAYPRQKLWIDTEDYVMRRAEQYALSGRHLKTMEVQEVSRQAGKVFPTVIRIEDKLKRNSYTRFITESIEIGIEIPPNTFSLEQLSF